MRNTTLALTHAAGGLGDAVGAPLQVIALVSNTTNFMRIIGRGLDGWEDRVAAGPPRAWVYSCDNSQLALGGPRQLRIAGLSTYTNMAAHFRMEARLPERVMSLSVTWGDPYEIDLSEAQVELQDRNICPYAAGLLKRALGAADAPLPTETRASTLQENKSVLYAHPNLMACNMSTNQGNVKLFRFHDELHERSMEGLAGTTSAGLLEVPRLSSCDELIYSKQMTIIHQDCLRHGRFPSVVPLIGLFHTYWHIIDAIARQHRELWFECARTLRIEKKLGSPPITQAPFDVAHDLVMAFRFAALAELKEEWATYKTWFERQRKPEVAGVTFPACETLEQFFELLLSGKAGLVAEDAALMLKEIVVYYESFRAMVHNDDGANLYEMLKNMVKFFCHAHKNRYAQVCADILVLLEIAPPRVREILFLNFTINMGCTTRKNVAIDRMQEFYIGLLGKISGKRTSEKFVHVLSYYLEDIKRARSQLMEDLGITQRSGKRTAPRLKGNIEALRDLMKGTRLFGVQLRDEFWANLVGARVEDGATRRRFLRKIELEREGLKEQARAAKVECCVQATTRRTVEQALAAAREQKLAMSVHVILEEMRTPITVESIALDLVDLGAAVAPTLFEAIWLAEVEFVDIRLQRLATDPAADSKAVSDAAKSAEIVRGVRAKVEERVRERHAAATGRAQIACSGCLSWAGIQYRDAEYAEYWDMLRSDKLMRRFFVRHCLVYGSEPDAEDLEAWAGGNFSGATAASQPGKLHPHHHAMHGLVVKDGTEITVCGVTGGVAHGVGYAWYGTRLELGGSWFLAPGEERDDEQSYGIWSEHRGGRRTSFSMSAFSIRVLLGDTVLKQFGRERLRVRKKEEPVKLAEVMLHEERLAVKKKQEELGANEFAYVDVETRMIKVAERRSASQGSQGASLGAPVMSTMEADEYRREEEQERFELRMDKFWEEAEETQRRKLREEGQYEAREKRRAEERAPVARSQGLGAEPEANEDTPQQPDVMASVLEEEHMLALEDDGLE